MDNQNMNTSQTPIYNQHPMYTPSEMTIGDWIITLILTCIPIVNIICLIVWAASSSPEKKSRKNWAIAQLIVAAVLIVISFIFIGCVGASLGAIYSSM